MLFETIFPEGAIFLSLIQLFLEGGAKRQGEEMIRGPND